MKDQSHKLEVFLQAGQINRKFFINRDFNRKFLSDHSHKPEVFLQTGDINRNSL